MKSLGLDLDIHVNATIAIYCLFLIPRLLFFLFILIIKKYNHKQTRNQKPLLIIFILTNDFIIFISTFQKKKEWKQTIIFGAFTYCAKKKWLIYNLRPESNQQMIIFSNRTSNIAKITGFKSTFTTTLTGKKEHKTLKDILMD